MKTLFYLLIIFTVAAGPARADDAGFITGLKRVRQENAEALKRRAPQDTPGRRLVRQWQDENTRELIEKDYLPLFERGAALIFDPHTVEPDPAWREIRHLLPLYGMWLQANPGKAPVEAACLVSLYKRKYGELELMLIDAEQAGREHMAVKLAGAVAGCRRQNELFDNCMDEAFRDHPLKAACLLLDIGIYLGNPNFRLNEKFYRLLERNIPILKQLPKDKQFLLLNNLIQQAVTDNKFNEKATLRALAENPLYPPLAELFTGIQISVEKRGQSYSSTGRSARDKKAPLKITVKDYN